MPEGGHKAETFPKFDGSDGIPPKDDEEANYSDWQHKTKGAIDARGVWDLATGPENAYNAATAEQKELMANLKKDLVRCLRGKALRAAKKANPDDLRNVLAQVKKIFTAQSKGKRRMAIRKLVVVQQGENQSISDFFTEKRTLLFETLGNRLTLDEILYMCSVGNVLPVYSQTAATLMASDTKTIGEAETELEELETQKEDDMEVEEDVAKAKMAKSDSANNNSNEVTNVLSALVQEVKGLGKGQYGGSWKGNWSGGGWNGGWSSGNAKKVKKTCNFCGEFGHEVKDCRAKKNQRDKKKGKGKGGKGKGKR